MTNYESKRVIRRSSFVIRRSLFVIRRSLFVIRRSSLEKMVSQSLILTPLEVNRITMCTLQQHFWQQLPPQEEAMSEEAALKTIQRLHAKGGPQRLNLPTTLRYVENLLAVVKANRQQLNAARQAIAAYHRRLRNEWTQVIASNELLTMNIRVRQGWIQIEAVVDRLDKGAGDEINAINFITHSGPVSDLSQNRAVEATMLHALVAAAYPHRRPVQVSYRWLYHNQEQRLQLTERQYRENLAQIKERVEAWLDGEILARPGLHCEECPFKHQGCPIYPAEDEPPDLPINNEK